MKKAKRNLASRGKKAKEAIDKLDAGFNKLPVDMQPETKLKGSPAPPTLLETVIEMRPYTTRHQLVRVLSARYDVSVHTVDRAIAKAKAYAAERYSNREQLLQDGIDFLDRVKNKAYKEGKFQAARGAAYDQQKLVGNTRPDVLIIGSMEAPAAEQLAQADAMQKKTLEALKKAGMG